MEIFDMNLCEPSTGTLWGYLHQWGGVQRHGGGAGEGEAGVQGNGRQVRLDQRSTGQCWTTFPIPPVHKIITDILSINICNNYVLS